MGFYETLATTILAEDQKARQQAREIEIFERQFYAARERLAKLMKLQQVRARHYALAIIEEEEPEAGLTAISAERCYQLVIEYLQHHPPPQEDSGVNLGEMP